MSKKLKYDELYDKYKNLVLQTAYLYSEDLHTAEDIMQETFMALYINIDTMCDKNIISWLITTAKNKTLNDGKKQGRQIPSSDLFEDDDYGPNVPGIEYHYLNKEATAERLYLSAQVFNAMFEKNQRWYQAMTMVCKMGIPREIVAEEMNISVEVLDGLLHRARVWARKEYGVTFKETCQY